MARSLPPRPNLDWLKKDARDRLAALRAADPAARLHHAQLAIAREYGFASWRKLRAHVEAVAGGVFNPRPVALDAAAAERISAAIRADETAQWNALLDAEPEIIHARLPDGQTALHAAAQQEATNGVAVLLDRGADANAKYGDSGHTPLSWAVTCHAFQAAFLLMARGVKPDLFTAAGLGLLDQVKVCFDDAGAIRQGASSTGSSRFGPGGVRLPCPPKADVELISDALCFACRNGHPEVVRFLLRGSPDLSFRGYLGARALHWASYGGSRSALKQLIEAGADQAARDDALECTPRAFGICVPANWGFIELVHARLVEDPSLATFMDGRTSALHEAARQGHARIVQLLLKAGANPAQVDGGGVTALQLASVGGHVEVEELLRAS